MTPTLTHRLILPTDANHHGTLYAGSLLRIVLEAAYATAWRHVGAEANLVLRRVLNLECQKPVRVGAVIEIQGAVMFRARAYLVVGLMGTPLKKGQEPWVEALLGFAQVDKQGRPTEIPDEVAEVAVPEGADWKRLLARMEKLRRLR